MQGKEGSKVPKAERPKVKPLVAQEKAAQMAAKRPEELRETCSGSQPGIAPKGELRAAVKPGADDGYTVETIKTTPNNAPRYSILQAH